MFEFSLVSKRSTAVAACLLAAAVVSSCTDSPQDVLAEIETPATRPTLTLVSDLPSLPSLVSGGRVDLSEADLLDWKRSWEVSADRGHPLREAVYDRVMPEVSAQLGEDVVDGALSQLEQSVAWITNLGHTVLPASIALAVSRAESKVAGGRKALLSGDRQHALRAALEAADQLREVTPRPVALALINFAESGLRRDGEGDPYPEGTLERAIHLLEGARAALESGDDTKAVQRAYYACLLLGVRVP